MTEVLETYGWDQNWQAELQALAGSELLAAGRVAQATRDYCQLLTGQGEVTVRVPGRFHHKQASKTALPVVGDWVAFKPGSTTREGSVNQVLTRRTLIIRQSPGQRGSLQEQAIAANVDSVFIVTGLDRDYNLRRIERYLALVHHSGAKPVLILNKLDLCDDPAAILQEVSELATELEVHQVCAHDPKTAALLAGYLQPGRTIACIGSSGAGKSTLINNLLGYQRQATGAVSETLGKGMHTTTHRELIPLESGAMLIDNPGMRELLPQADAGDLSAIFAEIEQHAANCRFNDCKHGNEPGCAVKQAVDEGAVSEERYRSFLKLQQEITDREQRQSLESTGNVKRRWQPVSKALKKRKKDGWIEDGDE
jgi:ribosome biogenesis GTPase / thiamine phosphate phosphatase